MYICIIKTHCLSYYCDVYSVSLLHFLVLGTMIQSVSGVEYLLGENVHVSWMVDNIFHPLPQHLASILLCKKCVPVCTCSLNVLSYYVCYNVKFTFVKIMVIF